MNKIVSNCSLCEQHSLHVIEQDGIGTQQCISCGYASTSNFIGTKEDNESFKTLTEEMQSWAKEANGRIWIPSIMTLPFGTLYPTNVDGEMKWAFAEMLSIPEEEQKNYPDENGGFYKQMYDTNNAKIYDIFLDAMVEMNKKAKKDISDINLSTDG
jgi:Zn ribbon nucleic-acid-binding protein